MSARFEMQPVAFRVEADIAAQLRDLASAQGCTVSDLLRRGALMAIEEPSRMVIRWTTGSDVTLLGSPQTVVVTASAAHSGRTSPGEGDGTPGSSTAESEAIPEAAIQAATGAVRDYWRESGGWFRDSTYQGVAAAAVRAAYPLIRQTVAEEIAAEIERNANLWEDHGQHPDGIAGARRAASIAREVGRG